MHPRENVSLALTARAEPERKQLMEMAAAWDRMAVEREHQIMRAEQAGDPEKA